MSAPVLWTSEDAVAATDGRICGRWQAAGVSIDSRAVAPGDLFVAIKGPSFDGHDFVAEAIIQDLLFYQKRERRKLNHRAAAREMPVASWTADRTT